MCYNERKIWTDAKGTDFFMDIFNEYIVKRKNSGKDYAKIFGIVLGSIVLYYVLLIVLNQLGNYGTMFILPALAGVIFLDWYLIRSFRVEYEYSVTNGYMVIDKIIARSRRKRQITFECRDVDEMKKFNPDEAAQKTFDKILYTDDNKPDSDAWSMELTHKDLGHVLVVFSPSDRILAAIKPFLKRQVAFHAFGH